MPAAASPASPQPWSPTRCERAHHRQGGSAHPRREPSPHQSAGTEKVSKRPCPGRGRQPASSSRPPFPGTCFPREAQEGTGRPTLLPDAQGAEPPGGPRPGAVRSVTHRKPCPQPSPGAPPPGQGDGDLNPAPAHRLCWKSSPRAQGPLPGAPPLPQAGQNRAGRGSREQQRWRGVSDRAAPPAVRILWCLIKAHHTLCPPLSRAGKRVPPPPLGSKLFSQACSNFISLQSVV